MSPTQVAHSHLKLEYVVQTSDMITLLRNLRLSKYIDIAFLAETIRISSMDSKSLLGYAAVDLPVRVVEEGPHQFGVAANIEHTLLLKTLERFHPQPIYLQPDRAQNLLKIRSEKEEKEYVIPCTFSGNSRDVVFLHPAAGQVPDLTCTLQVRVFKELLKNLQAIDVRAQITFIKKPQGNQVLLQSLSANTHYHELIVAPAVKIELQMEGQTCARTLLIPGDINNLLKIIHGQDILLEFYEEYLYLRPTTRDSGQEGTLIILPLVSSYYG